LDIIQRSGDIFNKTLVGVGKNADKKYLFTFPERVHLIQGAISKELYDTMDIEIKPYSGLLVNFAKEEGVATILRGIRNSEDLTGEQMLHLVGESQKL
jgi:pantetheine-phosphate adenylyltransferase